MTDATYEPTDSSSNANTTPGVATEPRVVLEAEHISKAYRRRWRRTEKQVLTDANLTIAGRRERLRKVDFDEDHRRFAGP